MSESATPPAIRRALADLAESMGSNEQLGALIGVNRSTIHRYLTVGSTHIPIPADRLLRIVRKARGAEFGAAVHCAAHALLVAIVDLCGGASGVDFEPDAQPEVQDLAADSLQLSLDYHTAVHRGAGTPERREAARLALEAARRIAAAEGVIADEP